MPHNNNAHILGLFIFNIGAKSWLQNVLDSALRIDFRSNMQALDLLLQQMKL